MWPEVRFPRGYLKQFFFVESHNRILHTWLSLGIWIKISIKELRVSVNVIWNWNPLHLQSHIHLPGNKPFWHGGSCHCKWLCRRAGQLSQVHNGMLSDRALCSWALGSSLTLCSGRPSKSLTSWCKDSALCSIACQQASVYCSWEVVPIRSTIMSSIWAQLHQLTVSLQETTIPLLTPVLRACSPLLWMVRSSRDSCYQVQFLWLGDRTGDLLYLCSVCCIYKNTSTAWWRRPDGTPMNISFPIDPHAALQCYTLQIWPTQPGNQLFSSKPFSGLIARGIVWQVLGMWWPRAQNS